MLSSIVVLQSRSIFKIPCVLSSGDKLRLAFVGIKTIRAGADEPLWSPLHISTHLPFLQYPPLWLFQKFMSLNK